MTHESEEIAERVTNAFPGQHSHPSRPVLHCRHRCRRAVRWRKREAALACPTSRLVELNVHAPTILPGNQVLPVNVLADVCLAPLDGTGQCCDCETYGGPYFKEARRMQL